MPATVVLLEFVADHFCQELAREPALNLAANLLLIPAGFRLIQFHGESAQILLEAVSGCTTLAGYAAPGRDRMMAGSGAR
jgi:hypothetical protein